MNKTYKELLDYYSNATKEQVIEDLMLDNLEIERLHSIIKEAREYIKEHTTHYISYLGKEHKKVPKIELQREAYDKLLEILERENNE